jgi:hypothetical protein
MVNVKKCSMRGVFGRKGQSAGAVSTFLILLAGLIVLYILFLPAGERQALLQDSYSSPGGYDGSDGAARGGAANLGNIYLENETALQVSPGRIDYLKFDEYEHPISAVNLYSTTTAEVLKSEESLYIKNGLFDQLFREVTFSIPDLENTENVLLSFGVQKASGRLTLRLNGDIIYDGYVDRASPEPITLDRKSLRDINVLSFEVDPVGFAFWRTNEYEFRTLKITADVTDVGQQASQSTFTVTDVEKFNLQRSTLKFFPDCSPRDVGTLRVMINNEQVFSGIPDCGQINLIEFSPSAITAGNNRVTFSADDGDYLVYQILVKNELKEQVFPSYYFDLDPSLFYFRQDYKRDRYYREDVCGAVDGLCPQDCTEDEDIDCCFDGREKYWCDVEPEDKDLRCATVTSVDKCSVCPTGYEDQDGRAADECEDICGDDKDGVCPSGCSKYYDEDCCYEQDEDNFWCDNVPKFGLENVCESSLTREECSDCESGYKSDGNSDACEGIAAMDSFIDVAELKPGLKVFLVMEFIDDEERKSAFIYVNGHKFYIDTYNDYFERDISEYIEEDSNALKLEPDRSTLDIRELSVDVRLR